MLIRIIIAPNQQNSSLIITTTIPLKVGVTRHEVMMQQQVTYGIFDGRYPNNNNNYHLMHKRFVHLALLID